VTDRRHDDPLNRRTATDDDFLTRREANVILRSGEAAHSAALKAHEEKHAAEQASARTALEVADRERVQHDEAHKREHHLHGEKHAQADVAIEKALDAVARERAIHAEAHQREHEAHQREHAKDAVAIDKAEKATDLRFAAANAFREQISDMTRTFATKEALDSHLSESDRRIQDIRATYDRRVEELRNRVELIEKGDVKQEGRGIGQAATVAAIVAAVGFFATLLGIVIVLANVFTQPA
jgi:hypothetical protein